jgi:hypothetical protein
MIATQPERISSGAHGGDAAGDVLLDGDAQLLSVAAHTTTRGPERLFARRAHVKVAISG